MTTTAFLAGTGWNRRLAAAAAAVPLLFVLHSRLVSPRPYTVSEIDIEHDYYYNAKLLVQGQPVGSSHHPGTPVYYLSSVLLRLSGSELSQTQQFFSTAYWLVALASAAVLAYFCSTVLRGVGLWAALMAQGLVLAWPPVLSYWSYYGADSWSLCLGLLAVSFFWIDVSSPDRKMTPGILCGAAVGVGLAVKMTFLPLLLSLLLGKAVLTAGRWRRAWRSSPEGRPKRLGALLASSTGFPVACASAYLLSTMPIVGRLPAVWLSTFQREEVRPPSGAFGGSLASGLLDLWQWNPALVLAGWLAIGGWVAVCAALAVRSLLGQRKDPSAPDSPGNGNFDYAAAGAFLGVLLLAFSYTIASSVTVTPGAELGIRLRNTAPSALVLPLMVLFVDRARHEVVRDWFGSKSMAILAGLGALSFVLAWTAIARHRQAFVEKRDVRSKQVQAILAPPSQPPHRLAFWTESADDHFGEMSFHFWGNYRYGYDWFDAELLRRYPGFTFLRFRDYARLPRAGAPLPGIPAPAGRESENRPTSRYGWAGDLYWRVSHWLPRAFPKTVSPYQRQLGLVMGEKSGIKPSVFAFEESQMFELRGIPLSSYVRTLEDRYGALGLEKVTIAGEKWFVLRGTELQEAVRGGPQDR